MKKALVTGANGFIGSNLVRHLIQKGWDVCGLLLDGTSKTPLEGLPVQIFYGNILEPDSVINAVKEVDVVFHLAALTSDWGPKEKFFLINATGTKNMLEVSTNAGVQRFILTSSIAVHRYSGHLFSDENTPLDCPRDFHYGMSKIEAESALREYHQKGKLEGVIIRPALFPFGPNDMTSFYPLARSLEHGYFVFTGGGKSKLTTAYVENLCEGIYLAAISPEAPGNVYLIGDEKPISWKELIGLFCRELGVPPPKISIPSWLADLTGKTFEYFYKTFNLTGTPPVTRYRASLMAKDLVFVSQKAKKELGYHPVVTIEEGIRRTVKWYRSIQYKTD